MNKRKLLTVLSIASVAVLSSVTFADEITPSDPTAPSTPLITPTPVDPGTPTDTTKPSTPVDSGTSTNPSDSEATNTNLGTKPTDVVKPETPKIPEVPSTVTPDVIDKVDKETGNITIKPIQISPDKTIIGTQNGNVIIRDSSGSHLVSASEVGGRLNEDGTVTIKDSSGKTKTLSRTGEAKGFLSIIGATILSFVAYLFKQRVTLN